MVNTLIHICRDEIFDMIIELRKPKPQNTNDLLVIDQSHEWSQIMPQNTWLDFVTAPSKDS